jgi:hypothetical protein
VYAAEAWPDFSVERRTSYEHAGSAIERPAAAQTNLWTTAPNSALWRQLDGAVRGDRHTAGFHGHRENDLQGVTFR